MLLAFGGIQIPLRWKLKEPEVSSTKPKYMASQSEATVHKHGKC